MQYKALVVRLVAMEFALGSAVSALASGRFTPRLIIDGAISFAFVPAIDLLVVALLLRLAPPRDRRVPGAGTLARYLQGDAPWLMWLAALSAAGCLVPPRSAGMIVPIGAISMLVPAWLTARRDLAFFRAVASPRLAPVTQVVAARAVGWSLAVAYFFGIAIWYEILPVIGRWVSP